MLVPVSQNEMLVIKEFLEQYASPGWKIACVDRGIKKKFRDFSSVFNIIQSV